MANYTGVDLRRQMIKYMCTKYKIVKPLILLHMINIGKSCTAYCREMCRPHQMCGTIGIVV